MMSLWTPYTKEEVLDLSAKAATVKAESVSPVHREPAPATSPGVWESRLPPPPQSYLTYPSPEASLYGERCCSPRASPCWSSGSSSPTERSRRPFKLAATSLPVCEDGQPTTGAEPEFLSFRESMLAMMRARNGGRQCVSNPRMRRSVRRSTAAPDTEYLERRERNNAAAKRSRDLRKMREDELAIRAAYLERCNRSLTEQLQAATAELAVLRAGRRF